MKNTLISTLLLCLFLAFINTASAQSYRTFRDESGREIEARPISVVGKLVRIERKDGHEFNVNPDIFVKEDAQYLETWMYQFLGLNGNLLAIKTKSGKSDTERTRSASTHSKKWKGFYKIEIENKSDLHLDGLRVEYRYYKFSDVAGAKKKSQGTHSTISGKSSISLLPRRSTEITTTEVDMSESQLNPGWSYFEGGSKTAKDKLTGIWVRVYKGKKMITQFANPTSLMTEKKWGKKG